MFVRKDNYDFMAYLGEVLIPENAGLPMCMDIFYNTTNYFQMGVFSKCVRRLFEVNSEHVKIYPKGTAWVRDIWLTNSMWSLSDFMLHGCKGNGSVADSKPKLAKGSSRLWYNPFTKPFNFTECAHGNTSWNHNNVLITSKEQIESRLHEYAREMEALNAKVVRELESGCSPSLIERIIHTAKAYL
ncbi:unnamed protein product [Cylicocyclus nassatus]|uniref:Uncharacterized protein n=1 Tax=Cylicocyclus nassatus TaxID=53992 RepID=A0AA36DKS6_CYLNA|nr:unnamed protein product [Cylicocyclus nassatus]